MNPTDHVFDEGFYQVNYDDSESYRNQFLSCIKKVQEPYILYTSEDYILYDQVKEDKINQLVKVLSEDSDYNSIKLIKGGEKVQKDTSLNLTMTYILSTIRIQISLHNKQVFGEHEILKKYLKPHQRIIRECNKNQEALRYAEI